MGIVSSIGSFTCSPLDVILFDQFVFVRENGRVNVMSFQVRATTTSHERILFHCDEQGSSRQALTFAQNEGEVNSINSNGSYLVIGSTKGYVKVFDVSRR